MRADHFFFFNHRNHYLLFRFLETISVLAYGIENAFTLAAKEDTSEGWPCNHKGNSLASPINLFNLNLSRPRDERKGRIARSFPFFSFADDEEIVRSIV